MSGDSRCGGCSFGTRCGSSAALVPWPSWPCSGTGKMPVARNPWHPTRPWTSPSSSSIGIPQSFTIPCISSIYSQTHGLEFEVLVVDNASADDSCRAIQERCPSVKLIRSAQNLGFARANNLGFQNSSGRILLFLNPDTELRGPAINLMYRMPRRLLWTSVFWAAAF